LKIYSNRKKLKISQNFSNQNLIFLQKISRLFQALPSHFLSLPSYHIAVSEREKSLHFGKGNYVME
jgi:hypothetical protein